MKRKSNNAQKRYRRVADALIRNNHVSVVFCSGNKGYSVLVNKKTHQSITPTHELIDAVMNLRFKWSILIAVLCRDDSGSEYMKSEQVNIDVPLQQQELSDHLDQRHKDLVDKCNKKHLVGVAWAASPSGADWDEEDSVKLFSKFKGWDGDNETFIREQMVA